MINKKKTIVDKINEKNEKKYGPRCPVCELYQTFCRCPKKNKSKDLS